MNDTNLKLKFQQKFYVRIHENLILFSQQRHLPKFSLFSAKFLNKFYFLGKLPTLIKTKDLKKSNSILLLWKLFPLQNGTVFQKFHLGS